MVTIKTLPIKIDDCTVTFQRLKVMTASRSKPNSILLVTSNPSPVARPANNGPAPGTKAIWFVKAQIKATAPRYSNCRHQHVLKRYFKFCPVVGGLSLLTAFRLSENTPTPSLFLVIHNPPNPSPGERARDHVTWRYEHKLMWAWIVLNMSQRIELPEGNIRPRSCCCFAA